jgi:hypothetical protein
MDSSSRKFSLWSVLVIVATVASATAGAGWQVGRSLIEAGEGENNVQIINVQF